MKKLICMVLSAVLFAGMLSVSAGAVPITRLPVDYPKYDWNPQLIGTVFTLTENTTLNTDLTVKEGNALCIPKGKRLTLKNGKTITVEGGIYIEEGGSLVIEDGTLLLKEKVPGYSLWESGTVLSYGKLNLKKNGKIVMKNKSNLVIGESGSLIEKGMIAEEGGKTTVICLGDYTGEKERKTEILAATTICESYYTNEPDEIRLYNTSDAKALFPTLSLAREQDGVIGAAYGTRVYLYCSNDQWFLYRIQGKLEHSNQALLGGLYVNSPKGLAEISSMKISPIG